MPEVQVALGLNIQAGLGAAIFGGALTGAVVSGTVTNLLTGPYWKAGLGSALLNSAVLGGIAGGVGYVVAKAFRSKSSRALQDLKTPTAEGPSGQFHSVAHEMYLDLADWGTSHATHVRRARASIMAIIDADPAFATTLDDLIPGASQALAAGKVPQAWRWHHSTKLGVMQLVPNAQHQSGSIFQNVLHPGGIGGYPIWAVPAGATAR